MSILWGDIGLTAIRQERVESGKERPGSLLYRVSERSGICGDCSGNGGKGQIFFIWDIYRLLSGAGQRE